MTDPIPQPSAVATYRVLESIDWAMGVDDRDEFTTRLESTLTYFPELSGETITVARRRNPEAPYSERNPYGEVETVNRILYIPADDYLTSVILFHELAHLAIRVRYERGEDVPRTSEEYCSLFAVARMPTEVIDEPRIPYLGEPRRPRDRWPSVCREILEYRENNHDYIQQAKHWLRIGPNYDNLRNQRAES